MEHPKNKRLKVFRSITGDLSPTLNQSFSPSFPSPFHLSNTLFPNSETSSIINYKPDLTYHPQVASRVLKNPLIQSLQQKICDSKQLSSQFLDTQIESQESISGNISGRMNLSTEDSSKEEMQERGKPKKRPLFENEKKLYVIRLDWIRSSKDTRTTVMIKNIPNKYSQKMLLHAIDRLFVGTYNFLYLPIDFKNRCNVGYAFINFVDFKVIVDFFLEFNEKRWERFNSEKVCAIAYARIQGLKELVQHFENSSVINQDDNKIKPVIMAGN